MRIGILSDTHGNLELARLAISKMGWVDCLLHAGDHYRDAKALSENKELPVYAVVGNCDWDVSEPEDLLVNAAGKRIWLTHGHKYGVKTDHQMLLDKANAHNIDIVVYGHTHRAVMEEVDGILIFNPGSLTYPRGARGPTYGVIEIYQNEIIAHIFEI